MACDINDGGIASGYGTSIYLPAYAGVASDIPPLVNLNMINHCRHNDRVAGDVLEGQ
jgi:hypothetical protein